MAFIIAYCTLLLYYFLSLIAQPTHIHSSFTLLLRLSSLALLSVGSKLFDDSLSLSLFFPHTPSNFITLSIWNTNIEQLTVIQSSLISSKVLKICSPMLSGSRATTMQSPPYIQF
jgi:hypothetical protein